MTPAVALIVEAGLEVIKQVLASIEAAKAGQKVDATAVVGEIQPLQDVIAVHNAAIDAAEAAKFQK